MANKLRITVRAIDGIELEHERVIIDASAVLHGKETWINLELGGKVYSVRAEDLNKISLLSALPVVSLDSIEKV